MGRRIPKHVLFLRRVAGSVSSLSEVPARATSVPDDCRAVGLVGHLRHCQRLDVRVKRLGIRDGCRLLDVVRQDGRLSVRLDSVFLRAGRRACLFLDRPGLLDCAVPRGMVISILDGNVPAEPYGQLGDLDSVFDVRAYVSDGAADPTDGICQRLFLSRASMDWPHAPSGIRPG